MEKIIKLDANDTKCLFLGSYKGIKAYRLMCLQTTKIGICRFVVFIEDSTSLETIWRCKQVGEMKVLRQSCRQSSKSSYCSDGNEHKEQVEDHLVANDEAIKISTEK